MNNPAAKDPVRIPENISKAYWLYVLTLEHSKYYVGITTKTPEIRMQQHISGFGGASWTRKYKPLRMFDKKQLGYMTNAEAERYENKVVRAYIKKYGSDNVRGGDISYSEDLVKRFGWYIAKDDWEVVTVIVLLVLIILFLGLNKYM